MALLIQYVKYLLKTKRTVKLRYRKLYSDHNTAMKPHNRAMRDDSDHEQTG